MKTYPNLLLLAAAVLVLEPTCSAFVPSPVSFRSAAPAANGTSLGVSQFQDLFKDLFNADGKSAASAEYDQPIADCLAILNAAAETKAEEPEEVVTALEDLEKLMRKKAKAEPDAAAAVLAGLNGSWRLVFTTGTKETQDKIKKTVNYFPVKAVQRFDTSTEPYGIENGIYVGDFALVRFTGPFVFNVANRKLEFDFTRIEVLGLGIDIKSGDAAKIGASTGLGSENNVKNAEKGKLPFFNWISADETIATARGGGGGLALWKRIDEE